MSRLSLRLPLTACIALTLAGCAALTRLNVPIGPCGFDVDALQFAGDALTQARCLLRPVATGGVLSPQPAELPGSLEALIGQPAVDLKAPLRRYLVVHHMGDAAIGGSLDAPLSHARDDDPDALVARYFVLHDTSVPWLGDAAAFPADTDPALNDLHRFAGPIGLASRGLFLHTEFAQPRRRDPAGASRNDHIAPLPGFTDAQYEQMALLYAAASARRGDWLIPAFHAALDEGIPGAHDDPQHFEIARFAGALERLRDTLAR